MVGVIVGIKLVPSQLIFFYFRYVVGLMLSCYSAKLELMWFFIHVYDFLLNKVLIEKHKCCLCPTSYINILIASAVIYPIHLTYPPGNNDIAIATLIKNHVYLTHLTSYIDVVIAAWTIILTSVPSLPQDRVTRNAPSIVHFTHNHVSLLVNHSTGIGTLEFKISYEGNRISEHCCFH